MWHSTEIDVTVRMILYLAICRHLVGMIQGLSSHSCLLAAHQENISLRFWKCNARFNKEACVVKSRKSLKYKFGPQTGNVIPKMTRQAVCGAGLEESKQCLYCGVTGADVGVISWTEWSGTDPTRTRGARVSDGVQTLSCPYIWQREKPKDCTEVITVGVNTIYPHLDTSIGVSVYCNLSFSQGGWTVLQKRYDGSVDFYRTWAEYAAGFGDLAGEHWLGLEALYAMTNGIPTELYIGLTDANDVYKYAMYGIFSVRSSSYQYRLTIGSYSGTAGDSLTHHNTHQFSTYDNDNDGSSSNCAVDHHGAWWYKECYHSNLNGKFSSTAIESTQYIDWYRFSNRHVSLKTSVMMFRPLSYTKP